MERWYSPGVNVKEDVLRAERVSVKFLNILRQQQKLFVVGQCERRRWQRFLRKNEKINRTKFIYRWYKMNAIKMLKTISGARRTKSSIGDAWHWTMAKVSFYGYLRMLRLTSIRAQKDLQHSINWFRPIDFGRETLRLRISICYEHTMKMS